MSTSRSGSGYPNPIHPSQTRIGWIGTGIMGAAMAGDPQSAGYSLTIHTRSPSKAASLLSSGAQLADSSASLASRCHVIFSMVGRPADVSSVLLDPKSGAVSHSNPGSIFVDCTSSDPDLARQIAIEARKRDCFAIDAPVSGGDGGAREGNLAILAGGEREIVQYLSPLFELIGKVTWMGPPGSGQSSKIANQILVAANVMGLTEGILFARKAGLDLEKFLEAVGSGAAGSKVMEIFGERVLKRDFTPGGFAEYFVKDLGMALERDKEEAEPTLEQDKGNGVPALDQDMEKGVPALEQDKGKGVPAVLPGAEMNRQMFVGMVASGDGKMGMQGVITVYERMNGFESS